MDFKGSWCQDNYNWNTYFYRMCVHIRVYGFAMVWNSVRARAQPQVSSSGGSSISFEAVSLTGFGAEKLRVDWLAIIPKTASCLCFPNWDSMYSPLHPALLGSELKSVCLQDKCITDQPSTRAFYIDFVKSITWVIYDPLNHQISTSC